MAVEQLYIVTRATRTRYLDRYRPFFWFTAASSAADAVRRARRLLPAEFGPDERYAAPTAALVSAGGPVTIL